MEHPKPRFGPDLKILPIDDNPVPAPTDPGVEEIKMDKYKLIIASYGRSLAVALSVALGALGHLPSTAADLKLVAFAFIMAMIGPCARAANPKDTAFGVGGE
jgi:hypothetical protein